MLQRGYLVLCVTMFIMIGVRMMAAETKNILMDNKFVGPLSEQPEFEPQRYSGPGSSLGITYESNILANKPARQLLKTLSLSPEFAKYGMNAPSPESKSKPLEPVKTPEPTRLPIPYVPRPPKPPVPPSIPLPPAPNPQNSYNPVSSFATPESVSSSSSSTKPSSSENLGSSSITSSTSAEVSSQKASQSWHSAQPESVSPVIGTVKPAKTFNWLFGPRPSKLPGLPTISDPLKTTGTIATQIPTATGELSAPPTIQNSGTGLHGDSKLTNIDVSTPVTSFKYSTTTEPATTDSPKLPDGATQPGSGVPLTAAPPKLAVPAVPTKPLTSIELAAQTGSQDASEPSTKFPFSRLFSWRTKKPTPSPIEKGSSSNKLSKPSSPAVFSSAKPSPLTLNTVAEDMSAPLKTPVPVTISSDSAPSSTSGNPIATPLDTSITEITPAPLEAQSAPNKITSVPLEAPKLPPKSKLISSWKTNKPELSSAELPSYVNAQTTASPLPSANELPIAETLALSPTESSETSTTSENPVNSGIQTTTTTPTSMALSATFENTNYPKKFRFPNFFSRRPFKPTTELSQSSETSSSNSPSDASSPKPDSSVPSATAPTGALAPSNPASTTPTDESSLTQTNENGPVEVSKAPTKFRYSSWRPNKITTPSAVDSYKQPNSSSSSTLLSTADQPAAAITAGTTKPSTSALSNSIPAPSSKPSSTFSFTNFLSWKSDRNYLKGNASHQKSVQSSVSIPSSDPQSGLLAQPQSTETPSAPDKSTLGASSLGSSLGALKSALFSSTSPSKIPSKGPSVQTFPPGLPKSQGSTSPTLASPSSSWHSKSSSKFTSSFTSSSPSSHFSSVSSSGSSSSTTTATSFGTTQASPEVSSQTNENPSGSKTKPGRFLPNFRFNDMFGSIMNGISSIRNPRFSWNDNDRWSTKRRSFDEHEHSLSTTRNVNADVDENLQPFEVAIVLEEDEEESKLNGDAGSSHSEDASLPNKKPSNSKVKDMPLREQPNALGDTINIVEPPETFEKLNQEGDEDLIRTELKPSLKNLPSTNEDQKQSFGQTTDQSISEQSPSSAQRSSDHTVKDAQENYESSKKNKMEDQSINEIECDAKAVKQAYSDNLDLMHEANRQ